jgi:hypothetical protein
MAEVQGISIGFSSRIKDLLKVKIMVFCQFKSHYSFSLPGQAGTPGPCPSRPVHMAEKSGYLPLCWQSPWLCDLWVDGETPENYSDRSSIGRIRKCTMQLRVESQRDGAETWLYFFASLISHLNTNSGICHQPLRGNGHWSLFALSATQKQCHWALVLGSLLEASLSLKASCMSSSCQALVNLQSDPSRSDPDAPNRQWMTMIQRMKPGHFS